MYELVSIRNLIMHDDRLEFIHRRVGKAEHAAYSAKQVVYRDEDPSVEDTLRKWKTIP